jgi:dienelactone hydrolase
MILALSTAAFAAAIAGDPTTVSMASAPEGVAIAGVEWVTVSAPGLGVMRAAVARPSGRGPFPAVVVLHGTHGFATEYVELARDLARGGVVAVAPCWFAGSAGSGARFVTKVACPEAPPMPSAATPEAARIIEALVEATGKVRGVDPQRIALFGHSRGGGAVLNAILAPSRVRAAILHSAGYPPAVLDRVASLQVPVLIQHGEADSAADGGSTFTAVQKARDFEAALRRAGKPVEAMYYAGGGHNGFFTNRKQRRDETRRIVSFLRSRLR